MHQTEAVRPEAHVTIRQASAEDLANIVARRPQDAHWAEDFPSEADVGVASHAVLEPDESGQLWHAPWIIQCDGLDVGMIGIKYPPLDGVVEIGYGVAPSARNRHVARKAVAWLVNLAGAQHLVVVAETLAANLASQAVLRAVGFDQVGRRHDAVEGEILLWRLDPNARSSSPTTPG